jgi:hypothetical protein
MATAGTVAWVRHPLIDDQIIGMELEALTKPFEFVEIEWLQQAFEAPDPIRRGPQYDRHGPHAIVAPQPFLAQTQVHAPSWRGFSVHEKIVASIIL